MWKRSDEWFNAWARQDGSFHAKPKRMTRLTGYEDAMASLAGFVLALVIALVVSSAL